VEKNKIIRARYICLIAGCTLITFFTVFEAVKLFRIIRFVEQERRETGDIIPVTEKDIEKLVHELSLLKGPDSAEEGLPPGAVGSAVYKTFPGISEIAAVVRRLLEDRHIRPERFRITGKEPESLIEFQIRCTPVQFFDFLSEAGTEGTIAVSSVSIRTITDTGTYSASSKIDVTVKVKSRIPVLRNVESPQRAVKSIPAVQNFYMPRLPLPGINLPRKDTSSEDRSFTGSGFAETETQGTADYNNNDLGQENKIIFLGIIRDVFNKEFIYGKDIESGRIVMIQNGEVMPSHNQRRESE
jgi:hypothetical protein